MPKRNYGFEKRQKELVEVEKKIAAGEGAISELEAQMADPLLYSDAGRWREISTRHQGLKDEVEQLFNRWEELQGDD